MWDIICILVRTHSHIHTIYMNWKVAFEVKRQTQFVHFIYSTNARRENEEQWKRTELREKERGREEEESESKK